MAGRASVVTTMNLCPATGARSRLAGARLYAITPELAPERLLDLVEAYVEGGADVVQLRQKSLGRGSLFELAQKLGRICAGAGVLFIVNDHLDIALAAGADGVHLGEEDLPLAAARRVAGPDLLIGASASTAAAALDAVAQGADYIGSGPAFPTPIKAAKPVIGPAGILAVAAAVSVPVFAIGGIDRQNVGELVKAGIRRACVIRALASAEDPAGAVRALRGALT